jgi:hypothetical protein
LTIHHDCGKGLAVENCAAGGTWRDGYTVDNHWTWPKTSSWEAESTEDAADETACVSAGRTRSSSRARSRTRTETSRWKTEGAEDAAYETA